MKIFSFDEFIAEKKAIRPDDSHNVPKHVTAPEKFKHGSDPKFAKWLEVKTSTIPNAGNGLFAKKAFHKGEKIDEYTGTIISAEKADEITNNAKPGDISADYLINLSNGKVLDCYKTKCLAGIANDAEGYVKMKGYHNNAEIQELNNNRVFLVATKDIPEGAEIFVAYGPAYWEEYKKNLKLDSASS